MKERKPDYVFNVRDGGHVTRRHAASARPAGNVRAFYNETVVPNARITHRIRVYMKAKQ